MGMVCGSCGVANRDAARFCAECGERLLRRCATCDAELADGVRFCDACGAPVLAAVDSPAVVEQTRKIVTVLFADLAGSTPMQEQMDPESVRAFNARYYTAMRAAVEDRGGRIVKFVGDGVMAVFGVPEVAEDDAPRALAAAVDMVDAFAVLAPQIRRERGVDTSLRIGVNTGEVVVDEGDDDVVGDAVNIAARLEQFAPRGGILVGEDTYRLTRERAVFEPPQELQIRGRSGAVSARVLTSLDHRGAEGPSVFVGRADELTTLVGAVGVAEATNRARLVTIVGSPGVGKSRLLEELHGAVGDVADVFAGRCDAASASAFAPVAEIVRGAVDAAGGVDALLGDDAERERVAPVIDALVSGGEPGTPQETFWAVRRVLEAAARRRPIVVVLDDLHWAEPLLLDLVEHLAEWLGPVPVLLVAAARPELRELRPALVDAGGRPAAVLALEGLDAQSTQRLAVELLGSGALPADVVARIVSATEGNPLFVRELVRMLVDDGVLRADSDGWVVTIDARDIDVPPTISSLLAARVERLRADERTVLERASVIGHEVYRGALVELLPVESRAVLDTVLESLRRKELLEPAGTYWIDEPVLRFHHALIRDAAYRRLLKETRADLHERTAEWLRAKTGGGAEHDEVIGFHLEQAQANRRELGPLDEHGRGIATEAAARLAGAAQRALHRDDLPAAATLSGRALLCVDADDRSRPDMLLVRCEALLGTGDIGAARGAVDELEALGAGDAQMSAWATAFRVQLATLTGEADLDDASNRASDAAAQLAALGDPTGAAKAHRVHASVLARQGRVGETEAALDRALTAAREADDSRQISGVLAAAPLAALWGPSPVPRAGGRCLDVVRLLRITTGARPVEAIATRCQAVLEALRGRTDAARTMLDVARRTLEDLGLGHGLLELELFAGLVELAAGDAVAAEAHLAVAYDGFHRLGIEADAAQAAALRARAALAVDDDDRALTLAVTAEQLGGRDLKTAIAWRAVKAEVLARRGQHAEAIALARAATELADPTDALLDRADAQAALGAVLTTAGDVEGGRRATDQARSLYQQKGATALAARLGGTDALTDVPPPQVITPVGAADDEHENLATTAFYEFTNAMARGEPSRVPSLDSFLFEDRRRGLEAAVVGEAGDLVVHLPNVAKMQRHTLAVRGERLCLAWGRYEYVDTAFVNESLSLVGIDAEGSGEFTLVYDVTDVTDAILEIDERYAVGEGAAHAEFVMPAARFAQAWNARDWDAFDSICTPDIVMTDHRLASFGTASGVTALVERFRTVVEVTPDFISVGRRLAALQGPIVLVEVDSRPGAGAEPTLSRLALFEAVHDRVCRYEIFEIDDRAAALARVEELVGTSDRDENFATRVFYNFTDAMARGEASRIRSLSTFLLEDRRRGLGNEIVGEAGPIVADLSELANMQRHTLAVRGDRLALMWARSEYVETEFVQEYLSLLGTDAEGRAEFTVLYDVTDFTEAILQIDERYAVGEGAAHAEILLAASRFGAALNARDWAALDSLFAPDVPLVDHRRASFGAASGVAALIERSRSLAEVAPDFVVVGRRLLALDGHIGLVEVDSRLGAGAEPRSSQLILFEAAQGRLSRYENFEIEDRPTALARFHELAGERTGALENEATRTVARTSRTGNWLDRLLDTPAMRIAKQHADDVTPVAVRGDQLALVRATTRGDSGETRVLVLVEIDQESSSISSTFDFDESDIAAAMVALDARARALLPPREAAAATIGDRLHAAVRTGDADAMAACLTDDFVVVDHRLLGRGVDGGDDFVDRTVNRAESTTELFDVAAHYTAAPHGGVVVTNEAGVLLGGGRFEIPRVSLFTVRDGKVDRVELFHHEQFDAALARLEELRPSRLENRAVRTLHRMAAAVEAQDVDRFVAEMRDDFVGIDRRPLQGGDSRDRAHWRHVIPVLFELGLRRLKCTPIAVRGDLLALVSLDFLGDGDDYRITVLSVVEVDDAGALRIMDFFDEEDVRAAYRLLSERAMALFPPEVRASLSVASDIADVFYAGGDGDALRGFLAEEFEAVDHRVLGLGVRTRDEWIAMSLDARTLAAELFDLIQWIQPEPHGSVYTAQRTGRVGGGEVEVPLVALVVVRDGRLTRVETFAEDDLDVAVARLAELAPDQ